MGSARGCPDGEWRIPHLAPEILLRSCGRVRSDRAPRSPRPGNPGLSRGPRCGLAGWAAGSRPRGPPLARPAPPRPGGGSAAPAAPLCSAPRRSGQVGRAAALGCWGAPRGGTGSGQPWPRALSTGTGR